MLWMEGITHEKDGEFHIDDWGIKWVYGYGFNKIENFPLDGASQDQMRAYKFPHEHMNQLFNAMDEVSASSAGFFGDAMYHPALLKCVGVSAAWNRLC